MTKVLTINGQTVLPIYVLDSPKDQTVGFQGFKKIPLDYGLWFPVIMPVSFHMQNVASPLLALGCTSLANNHYQIVSSEIWNPGQVNCPYKGYYVLECSPTYSGILKLGVAFCLDDIKNYETDKRLQGIIQ